uniref:Peptidase S1 domain-containing protein n=3 Tax=Ciona savignyi TaxID=51511 RepID=H2YAN1_CIOSA
MLVYLFAIFALASARPSPPIGHPRFLGNTQSNRIVGGSESVDGQFPWQVSMQQFGRHFCGGSLIDATHVMCAAHCEITSGVTANLGAIDYRSPDQTIAQKQFIPHPSYNSATFDYDYAVIVLVSAATLNSKVDVIKLAEQGKEYSGMASTSGWGYTTQFVQSTPYMMQYTDIPLVSQSNCQSAWGSVITITNRIQCAGGDRQVSSCMGDSGGPLTVQDNGETILIGAVSWVQSNCSPNYPGGYAKISAERSWIDAQLLN